MSWMMMYTVILILSTLLAAEAFQAPSAYISSFACSVPATSRRIGCTQTTLIVTMSNGRPEREQEEKKKKGFLTDLQGMFQNFDDVIDDFVYKRMGAGEQWYGKRKYDPSGRVDGDYNGMGRSDYFRIEIARVQKEEMEKRKQRRLEEE